MIPTRLKLMREPAGPPSLNAAPEPTSKPGPIMPVGESARPKLRQCQFGDKPPIAIICKCRDLSCRFNGALKGSFSLSASLRSVPSLNWRLSASASWVGVPYATALVSFLSVIVVCQCREYRCCSSQRERESIYPGPNLEELGRRKISA